ncbi:MAG: hypothetical protein SF051_11880 [Elusimicrobiota bacterium]|nr:hypothetical protein [Elusimicrobiota bacterium]
MRAIETVFGVLVLTAALSVAARAADEPDPAAIKAGIAIVDGDTFDYGGKRFRVFRLDAPDARRHAKCEAEIALHAPSTAYAQTLLGTAKGAEIRPTGKVQPAIGFYRERFEAELFLDGRSFTDLMVEGGHGKYAGDGGWCEKPSAD